MKKGYLYNCIGIAITLLVLAGCTVGPNYIKPETTINVDWHDQHSKTLSLDQQHSAWWSSFKDPVLDTLVTLALRSNLTLC